jgi:hypothetical protein
MNSDDKIFEKFLSQIYDEPISVEKIEQQSDGEQGASGCEIRYYKVHFRRDSKQLETKQMISKEALVLERRILALLCEQKQAVPPTFIPNISSERSRFYQLYADPQIEGHGHLILSQKLMLML